MTKVSAELRKVGGPPQGQPFVCLPLELLQSAAWTHRSLHCARLIDFLFIEHLNHAGSENGQLAAPWDQLQAFGLGRRFIDEAIKEAEGLGLVQVVRGGKRHLVERDHVSRYRLTFFAARNVDEWGRPYFTAATNEWKRINEGDVAEVHLRRIVARREKAERREKRRLSTPVVTDISVPPVNSFSAPRVNRSEKTKASAQCTAGELPYISRVPSAHSTTTPSTSRRVAA